MNSPGCHGVGEDNTHTCDLDFFDSFLGGVRLWNTLGTQSGGVVSEQGESLD